MDDLLTVLEPVIAVGIVVAGALLVTAVLRAVFNRLFRKVPGIRKQSARARNPFRLVLVLVGTRIALGATARDTEWFPIVDFVLVVGLVAAIAWLAAVILLIIEAALLTKYSTDTKDNRRMRRLKTQVTLARRVGIAVIITLAVASVLLTIPEVRALGAGILASAGLISIVAGLAVQSSLTNVFAGMQLAFTDAIRVDDVVVVEKLWGTIEEITMTYVVVRVWDDRRLILPSTYFTTTPFENWTRRQSAILGTVELDVDWRVPVEEMRECLKETLDRTELWDGRTGVLQVTDAVGGVVRLRILVSAADSGALFDLRCLIRETMVTFLQSEHAYGLPRQRWEPVPAREKHDGGRRRSGPRAADATDSALFTGSLEAVERHRQFAGPGEDAYQERERKAGADLGEH